MKYIAKNESSVAVIIQARMGSERVPRKMLKPFAGTTLMDIAVDKIKKSVIPHEHFYLSVAEPELKEFATAKGVQVFSRSQESANEDNDLGRIYEWHDKIGYQFAILISACNPFLTVDTINNFYKGYMNTFVDGMFAVVPRYTYFWDKKKQMITNMHGKIMNTKGVDVMYEAGHCLYAGLTSSISYGIWMGDFTPQSPALVTIPEKEALDIDYPWQFDMLEAYYARENNIL